MDHVQPDKLRHSQIGIFTKTKQMKPVLTFSLFALFLLLVTCSQAQEVKAKQKVNKTKVKASGNPASTIAINSTDSSNLANSNQLANTSWQTFVGDPVNDTLVIHYAIDSSDVRSKSGGEILINSVYAVNQDTVTFHDLGGQHACPSDQVGRYHILINGDTLKYDLIEDGCDGRSAVLKELTWQKVK